jgi:hypothetical protein
LRVAGDAVRCSTKEICRKWSFPKSRNEEVDAGEQNKDAIEGQIRPLKDDEHTDTSTNENPREAGNRAPDNSVPRAIEPHWMHLKEGLNNSKTGPV